VINELSGQAGSADLILAVGGGTISDIAKMVSLNADIPNWSVPTAPSVDAFTSGTSALKLPHRHKTEPARAAEVILADLDVMDKTPRLMFLAGAGDLLAKYLSYLDWKVAAWITGEYICEQTAGLCLESARQAIRSVRALAVDGPGALRSLTDAALLSGLAMQALMSSRPASSAEHTVAHYWELDHGVGNAGLELHGMLVGLSCRILLPVYREIYGDDSLWDFEIEDRLRNLGGEPPWEEKLAPEVRPFHRQMREEMEGGLPGTDTYRSRLIQAGKYGEQIFDLAAGLLRELGDAVDTLEGLSFPFRLSEFRMDPEQATAPFRWVRYLRNRYSSFNLFHEIGADQRVFELLDQEIGKIS
jgi:glycerol-1-phosphate dehydrogenase [NAD(P)+]